MTIIAYKEGVLASDSITTFGATVGGTKKKVFKTHDGFLFGGAGAAGNLGKFADWFMSKEDKIDLSDIGLNQECIFLIISPDGKTISYIDGQTLYPHAIKAPFHAIGSGDDLAIGAMAAGATAEEAVKIAIKFSTTCGGKVQKVTL